MRFATLQKAFLATLIVLCAFSAVLSAPATKAANGDYNWAVGVTYTAGQVVDYNGNRYKVVVNHVSQADWYPGCCAVLWSLVGALGGTAAPAGGAAVSGGTVAGAVTAPATPGGTWGAKIFAPYVDVMLWPTLDVSTVHAATGIKHFTLAFIFAGGDGSPTWGGITPMSQNFYLDIINKLRAAGGDVIVSFGGANGLELAQANTDAAALQAKYQAVINQYQLTWIDFDIEGPAVLDKPSVDRRNKVLAALQKANPKLTISYTLPALPTGLTSDGVYLLQSAAKAGFSPKVINIMAMDYGAGAAPNGATGMGGYAIAAAQATYAQAQAAGLKSAQIGVTPMIGVNDVQGEVFRVADATQLATWAATTPWMAEIAMWSLNRDTSKSGALYASSQVKQADYDFSKAFIAFESGKAVLTASSSTAATTAGKIAARDSGSVWGSRTFAPYVDVTGWPTLDISAVAQTTGANYFTLAFVVADSANDPAWGGVTKTSSGFYLDILTKLRTMGGDAIISFGGASGQELAIPITNVKTLTAQYQSVIDAYAATWIDFDIEGSAISDTAANDRRNQAITALQAANPNLKVGFTVAVMPNGLDTTVLALLESAAKYSTKIDVLNIMAMDYGPGAAPNGGTGMGDYAIAAAQETYSQLQSAGFGNTKVGITPMIGQNDVQGEIFRLADAKALVAWASGQSWVGEIAMWSVNRDTSVQGALYASSQITQDDYDFCNIFKAFNQGGVSTGQLPPSTATGSGTTGGSSGTTTKPKKKKKKSGKAARDVPSAEDEAELEAENSENEVDAAVADAVNALPDLPPWTFLDIPVPPARVAGGAKQPQPTLIQAPSRRAASASTPKLGKSLTWNAKTFAPYVDVTAWPTFDIVAAAKTAGVRYFALGFITADKSGAPSWGGYNKVSSGFMADAINTLRTQYHGDVIVSFGGAAGKELALKAKNVAGLVTLYQSVIDAYKITWADFDIEGSTLTNVKVNDMRNKALAIIKANNPGLIVSFTLPTEIAGLTDEAVALLKNAATNKLGVDVLNIMAMDYDPATCPGTTCLSNMGQNSIKAATAAHATLSSLGFSTTKVGITPMIGVNDISGEIFTLNNAQEMVSFALKNNWVAFLGFWSANRDNKVKASDLSVSSGITQGDWGFCNILSVFS
ncbi:hypothetical protein HDU87_001642 [Geranomyces variabilis]|uniref:GH18 domain-containing protein n=1 Tax=Geranomyces variabilis TaxID=109894 RepID=A0AAD5TMK9_9FUNG|nr:hypothetical protein HDU87_001642 [Geranomyces variabilis]